MSQEKLTERVKAYNRQGREAMLAILNELNPGQRKKLLKSPAVQYWFRHFGIDPEKVMQEK